MNNIRFSFTIILFIFISLIAKGGGDGTTNYYKLMAQSNATGRGLVYACADTEHGPWLYKESISSRFYGLKNSDSVNTKVYLYASPYEGYALEKWTDANGNPVTSGSNFSFNASSTTITSPTVNSFTAHFVDTYVSVFSANNDLCAVSTSPTINSAEDEVTLTATPKSGATFLGWRVKGTAAILSTQPTFKVIATSTKTTYEAVFRYTGTQETFVRMQSQSETSKFMSLVQDYFSYTAIMQAAGGYSNITKDEGKAKALTKAGEYLSQDFSLSESIYDPGQVILHDDTNNNFYAQGTNVGYITDGYACHHGGNASNPLGSGTVPYVGASKLKIDAQKVNYVSSRITMNPTVDLANTGVVSGTHELGDIYIYNNDGEISVSQTADNTSKYKWNKLTITDNVNGQYFAFNPTIQDAKTGMYYTTLRTSFSYKIKNPDKVKAYEINEISNGSAIMTPFEDGEVIPGDLAVVLESSSQNDADNILVPYNREYTKTNSVLFNKYGHRLHCYTGATNSGDQFDNCTEGGIGYYKVTYNSSKMGTMYKLSRNEAGEVGFWTKVASNEVVSGNEAYSTVPCALFKYSELNNLPIATDQFTYNITDPLTVAYVDKNDVIYAKDNNGADEQAPGEGEEDFMALHYSENTYVDHSNWVAIESNTVPTLEPSFSRIETTGKLIEASPNRRIQATRIDVLDEEGGFYPNTYCIVNFMPKSSHSTAHHNFFFAEPQANEIAIITWAQWAGNNSFIVPPGSGFSGSITVDFSLYDDNENPISLVNDHQYQFIGLIQKLASTKDATSSIYKVYPLKGLVDLEEIATGIKGITTQNEVISVRYYNTMGIESDVPFDGINIRVTTYSDGTRQASKIRF